MLVEVGIGHEVQDWIHADFGPEAENGVQACYWLTGVKETTSERNITAAERDDGRWGSKQSARVTRKTKQIPSQTFLCFCRHVINLATVLYVYYSAGSGKSGNKSWRGKNCVI